MALIFFFTSAVFLGLCIPFLPSRSFYLFFRSSRGKSSRRTYFLLAYLFYLLRPKLFERIIRFRPFFFLKSNSILSPLEIGFCSGKYIFDQILYLSQPISEWFNKPKSDSPTILATINFSKAFDSLASSSPQQTYFGWAPSCFFRQT